MRTAKSIICFFFSSTIYQSLVVRSTAGMWFIGIWVGKDKIFLFYFPSWWLLIHQLLHFSYRGLYQWMIYLVSPLNFVRYFLHFYLVLSLDWINVAKIRILKCVDRYASIVKEKKMKPEVIYLFVLPWHISSSRICLKIGRLYRCMVFFSHLNRSFMYRFM